MQLSKSDCFQFFVPYFTLYGFQYHAATNQYRRELEGGEGFQSIILSITPYDDELLLEFFLAARHTALEQMIYRLTNGFINYAPHSTSVVMSVAKLSKEGKPWRASVRAIDDLNTVLLTLEMMLEDYGWQHLRNWSTLSELERLFNAQPFDLSLQPNPFHKALRGTCMAKLCHRADLDGIYEDYRELLDEYRVPWQQIQRFINLNTILENYHQN